MICPICGAHNPDGDKKCFICSAPLDINPYENDIKELEQLSDDNESMVKNLKEEKKKMRLGDKILVGYLIILSLSVLCSCFFCIFSQPLMNNQEAVKEYIEENESLKKVVDSISDSTNNQVDSETGMTRSEYIENLTYEKLDLTAYNYSDIEISLPENMKEVQLDENDEEEHDADVHCWRFGVDYDIIQVGTMEEYTNMEDAANEIYTNGVDANYCSNMKMEEDTISGYPAIKISGLDSYNQMYLVTWVFEAPDKDEYVHYFAANVLVADKLLLESKNTYVYKGRE